MHNIIDGCFFERGMYNRWLEPRGDGGMGGEAKSLTCLLITRNGLLFANH